MSDQQAEKIILIMEELLKETKKNTELLEDVKNIFSKYDVDLLLEEEMLRNG